MSAARPLTDRELGVMDRRHKKILDEHLLELRNNMEWKPVLDYLIHHGVFLLTSEAVEEIKANKHDIASRRKLLEELQTRGPDAFYEFVQALVQKEANPGIALRLAEASDKAGATSNLADEIRPMVLRSRSEPDHVAVPTHPTTEAVLDSREGDLIQAVEETPLEDKPLLGQASRSFDSSSSMPTRFSPLLANTREENTAHQPCGESRRPGQDAPLPWYRTPLLPAVVLGPVAVVGMASVALAPPEKQTLTAVVAVVACASLAVTILTI